MISPTAVLPRLAARAPDFAYHRKSLETDPTARPLDRAGPRRRPDMKLKPGGRLKSAVCATEVMVIAAPDGDVKIECGGAQMLEVGGDSPGGEVSADHSDGTALGKRYTTESGDLELLCTKPGDGSLSLGGTPLAIKGAKPLPSSD